MIQNRGMKTDKTQNISESFDSDSNELAFFITSVDTILSISSFISIAFRYNVLIGHYGLGISSPPLIDVQGKAPLIF